MFIRLENVENMQWCRIFAQKPMQPVLYVEETLRMFRFVAQVVRRDL